MFLLIPDSCLPAGNDKNRENRRQESGLRDLHLIGFVCYFYDPGMPNSICENMRVVFGRHTGLHRFPASGLPSYTDSRQMGCRATLIPGKWVAGLRRFPASGLPSYSN